MPKLIKVKESNKSTGIPEKRMSVVMLIRVRVGLLYMKVSSPCDYQFSRNYCTGINILKLVYIYAHIHIINIHTHTFTHTRTHLQTPSYY